MRGAFLAAFGETWDEHMLERGLSGFRWHDGTVAYTDAGPFAAGLVLDRGMGPTLERCGDRVILAYGTAAAPLPDLQAEGRRFAAIEVAGRDLVAARDPLGLCPLFYREIEGTLWLATEVLPLATLAPTEPDLDALVAQAALVPDDRQTGFRGVYRVLPGHRLEAHLGNGCIERAYWSPGVLYGTFRGSRRDAEDEMFARLLDAVDRSVPPRSGILLSGGVDSTAIATMAARLEREPALLHVAFSGIADAAEDDKARAVAAALDLPLDVTRGEEQPWDPEDDLRTSIVPYLTPPPYTANTALARAVELGLEIVADGNDGDGVLGPPGREWGELFVSRNFRRLRELARSGSGREVAKSVLTDVIPPAIRLRRLRGRPVPPPGYLEHTARYFDSSIGERLHRIDHERWRQPIGEWRARQLRQVLPVTTVRFEEHELRSARFDVDTRHPFADRHLVEFLISLPAAVKVHPFRSKDLLRSALKETPTAEVLDRKDKPGYFGVLGRRVSAERCVSAIRASGVELPRVQYNVLYAEAERETVPLVLLMFLARAHVFAASA